MLPNQKEKLLMLSPESEYQREKREVNQRESIQPNVMECLQLHLQN